MKQLIIGFKNGTKESIVINDEKAEQFENTIDEIMAGCKADDLFKIIIPERMFIFKLSEVLYIKTYPND